MIVSSNASSEWFCARASRLLGLAAVVAGLGGCAISMPLPGLMDKETTGAIAAKPEGNSTGSPASKPVTPATMRAEAPLSPVAAAKAEAADN